MCLGFLEAERRTRAGVGQRLAFEVLGVEPGQDLALTLRFEHDVPAHDLAGRKIAILDALGDVIGVDRLAEVADVVGADSLVLTRLIGSLCELQSAGRGREPNLYRIRVAQQHLEPFAPGRAMTLVDDDMAEIVRRVELAEEARVGLVPVDAERLVGGNVDARVGGVVAAVRRPVNLSRIDPECAFEGGESLRAQLVPIAKKQRAPQSAGFGDSIEQVRGDKGLAGACGEREQSSVPTLRHGLQHGPDCSILVVSPLPFAALVGREQRPGGLGLKLEAHAGLVAGLQCLRCWKFGKGTRSGRQPAEVIVLDEKMPIRAEHERNVVALAIGLGLFEAVPRRLVLRLGFDQGQGNWLRARVDAKAEEIV